MLNTGWKCDSLQLMIFVYVCSKCSVVELKTRLETWNARNDVNCAYWFHISYLITVLAYLCSQWAPFVQIKYCMLDWSIYRQFVLNMGWKRDSLQMMIFVYVCSTCSVVEIKTRFETWIAKYGVNGVYWLHFYYLITVLALVIKLTSPQNGHQLSKSSILCLIGRSTDYLCYISSENMILSKWWYSYMFALHAA
jgi:DNA-directed RNA polymerase subunit RPC12/RpoP